MSFIPSLAIHVAVQQVCGELLNAGQDEVSSLSQFRGNLSRGVCGLVAIFAIVACSQEESGDVAPEDAAVKKEIDEVSPESNSAPDPVVTPEFQESESVDDAQTVGTAQADIADEAGAPNTEATNAPEAENVADANAEPSSTGEVAAPATTFGFQQVEQIARTLAANPFQPSPALPKPAAQLNYDQFRRIQNQPGSTLWTEDSLNFRAILDPRGYLFADKVRMNIVDDNGAREKIYGASQFNFLDLPLEEDVKTALGYSGFRLISPLNEAGKFDEVISFRGASFFRALGAGSVYGVSARGISVGTASSEGEEFPFFREFWLVKPQAGDREFTIYALLDGKSVTGAFEFRVEPGPNTEVKVRSTIIPRRDLSNFGVVPLTSMYYFSPHDASKQQNDFRPAVHDSQGLSFRLANGEWVWRPLTNPANLQVSVLAQDVPRGFGLMQRQRRFDDYSDIEAAYHLRPSVWVEPDEGWERGELTLVEIPTANEYNDNIVVFWKPGSGWKKGEAHSLSYTLHWSLSPPAVPDVISVAETRAGQVPGEGGRIFVVDFETNDAPVLKGVEANVSSSAGAISNVIIKQHPETGLTRLSFELDPENAQSVELRAVLTRSGKPVTETWIYRWRLP